jgi:uncharacterized protein
VHAVAVTGAVYVGTIRHRRFAEQRREFRHRIALAYLEVEGARADGVRARIADETGAAPDGPVCVLGHPWGFNPVRFYYCFDRDERLQAVLSEVTNTPWGERQSYVLTRGARTGCVLRGESEKLMHVSPFFGMDQRYDWRVTEPGNTLLVHIENREQGERAFDATLSLERNEMTRTSLAWTAASALRTLPLIYGHAAAIRLDGVRTRPHPARAAG